MSDFLYEERNPDSSVSKFVQNFWKFTNPKAEVQRYTILPDGFFDLIIKVSAENKISIVLYGLWTKEVEVIVPPCSVILGICFNPIAVEYIPQQNIAKIINSNTELPENFWNINTISFHDFDDWTTQISHQIINTCSKIRLIDKRKEIIFQLLFQSKGTLKVEELAKRSFWDSRQINRYFRNNFGLSLKTYSNILRCAASYREISNGELFPDDHFYDQSHFIKQIRKHTGHNPKELFKNKNDRFLQFFTSFRK